MRLQAKIIIHRSKAIVLDIVTTVHFTRVTDSEIVTITCEFLRSATAMCMMWTNPNIPIDLSSDSDSSGANTFTISDWCHYFIDTFFCYS